MTYYKMNEIYFSDSICIKVEKLSEEFGYVWINLTSALMLRDLKSYENKELEIESKILEKKVTDKIFSLIPALKKDLKHDLQKFLGFE